ncbi:hypothetical protein COCNU_02G010930 [Cocos nucifera]|uniref:Uncharacterized protein n=1 Tax=Cocos nucifera TaxID=13894 RepID=A0A8K0HZ46_COCNU|nr:hypothetical protein COCNU_02G010930 [Cocos nucifera]
MGLTEVKEVVHVTSHPSVEVQVKIPQVTSPLSTAAETLRTIVEFLWSHFSFEERQALEGEGTQHQMKSALRSLALLGHYLVSFAEITPRASALELVEAKEEIDRLSFTVAYILDGVESSIMLFHYYFTLKRHPGSRGWYVTLRSRKNVPPLIQELKELLSEQCLFNMGISQVGSEGMDSNLPRVLNSKTLQKRKAEMVSSKSARAWVGLVPAPSAFELEDPKPSTINDFKIVHDLDSLVLKGSQRSSIECLFSETILSLLVPDVSDLFSEEKSIEVVRTFRITPVGAQLTMAMGTSGATMVEVQLTEAAGTSGTTLAKVQLEASTLEVYDLACIKEALKARFAKAEAFEPEARVALQVVEEKMAMLQCDMEA